MNSKKSVSKLKKKLDQVFSLWIRIRDGGRCISCGVVKPITEMQNGHYVSRNVNALRYDERNCNCQCMPCNIWKNGNMAKYALALQEKYGEGILKELDKKSAELKSWKTRELEELIEKYSQYP